MRPEISSLNRFLSSFFVNQIFLDHSIEKKRIKEDEWKKKIAVFPKKKLGKLQVGLEVSPYLIPPIGASQGMCENRWEWSYEHDRCPSAAGGHFGPLVWHGFPLKFLLPRTNPENPRKLMKLSPTKNNVGILKEWGSGNFCRFIHISKGWIRRFWFQGNWSSTPLSYETNQRCPPTGHPNGPKVASALHLRWIEGGVMPMLNAQGDQNVIWHIIRFLKTLSLTWIMNQFQSPIFRQMKRKRDAVHDCCSVVRAASFTAFPLAAGRWQLLAMQPFAGKRTSNEEGKL